MVRQCISGKHFGRADFEADPLQMPEVDREAVLRKITSSAIKEYVGTLETYKNETEKDWCISAKHPGQDAADSLIPDSALVQEYYQLKS